MNSRKVKVVAGLQLVPAVLTAFIGYFIVMPTYGRWGMALSIAASALSLYLLGVVLFKTNA